jgi:hypothetical protein
MFSINNFHLHFLNHKYIQYLVYLFLIIRLLNYLLTKYHILLINFWIQQSIHNILCL